VAVQNEATLADARSFKEAEEHVAVPSPKKKSINVASNEKSPLLAHNINGEEHITFENEDSKEGEDEENVNKVSSFRFWLYLLTERFTPDENILKRPLKYIGARVGKRFFSLCLVSKGCAQLSLCSSSPSSALLLVC